MWLQQLIIRLDSLDQDTVQEIEKMYEQFGEDLRMCGGCREAAYCCRECQKVDWPSHRKVCYQARSERSEIVKQAIRSFRRSFKRYW